MDGIEDFLTELSIVSNTAPSIGKSLRNHKIMKASITYHEDSKKQGGCGVVAHESHVSK